MILDVYGKDKERKTFINNFIYASYSDPFCGVGSFEVHVPITEKSIEFLIKDNYILFDEGVLGVIKTRIFEQDEESQNVLVISGKIIHEFFLRRCFNLPHRYDGKLSAIAREMVTDLCIDPDEAKRVISLISLSDNEQYIPDGETFKTQRTGDYLADALEDVLSLEDKGYKLYPIFDNDNGYYIDTLEFRVLAPVDRTIGNEDDNTPVVFSSELNNIQNFTYEENADDYKNYAYGAGQGRGEERYIVKVGDEEAEDIDRYELYVDARDVQQEEEQSEEDYIEELTERTLERMLEHKSFVSVNGTIVDGTTAFRIGVDFNIGDYVSFKLDLLDLVVNVQIKNITKSYNNNREYVDLTFGFQKSSIRKILRKGGF
jgi:hypothetical protein